MCIGYKKQWEKETSSSTVSYQVFDIDHVQFIMIFILRDTARDVGGPSTDLFNLYAQFRYPASCFGNSGCEKLFENQVKSKIEANPTPSMEVPLTDGQILSFQTRLLSLTDEGTFPGAKKLLS